MKKLIAISVVFALVAGVAFAVDLGATVNGHVNLFAGDSSKSGDGAQVTGGMDRVRLQGSGEVGDGKFGGVYRFDGKFLPEDYQSWEQMVQGFAWWKPIDQFKLIIGQSGATDGFWGKDGISTWGFNQMAYDVEVALKGNMWSNHGFSGLEYTAGPWYQSTAADRMGLYMEIKPIDILGINIGLPVNWMKWSADYFKEIHLQVDLNLAFGNIALTYAKDNFYVFFGGSFGDLGIDVGLSVPELSKTSTLTHIYFGADVKYAAGAFGIKFRTAEGIPVKSQQTFMVNIGVLPYFAINDNITVFFNAEMGMAFQSGSSQLGWAINPYLRVGAEWGPTFYAGFQVSQDTKGGGIVYALPIGLTVGF